MRERTNWGDVLGAGWHNGKDLGFERPAMDQGQPGENK
jgi:hypothetical protein